MTDGTGCTISTFTENARWGFIVRDADGATVKYVEAKFRRELDARESALARYPNATVE